MTALMTARSDELTAAAPPGGLSDDELLLGLGLAELIVWRHDLATGLIQGNAAARRVLGDAGPTGAWSAADLLERVHPEDQPVLLAGAHQALEQAGPVDQIFRCRTANGTWRHNWTRRLALRNAAGQPTALLSVALDVTEHQLVLAQLHQADQRIALTTRALGIGTWEFDLPDGAIRWDAQMHLLRGLPPRDQPLDTAEMLAMVHPDDRPAMALRVQMNQDPELPQTHEFRVVWPNGEVHWLASRSVVVRDEAGQPLRRTGVNWDITEAREAALARQEQCLAQRENEAKSALLARLSHELRTPLNAILGFTQLLLGDRPDTDAVVRERRLRHILGAGQHLLALVDDVLTLARPEAVDAALQVKALDLDALLAETLPMVEPDAARHPVSLSWRPGGLRLLADPLRLRQVVLNLLTNAIKYNRPGGRVDVSAEALGQQVCIRVRDSGIGMPADQLASVFEPFRRLGDNHPGVQGLGVGLAVVRSLVERMGGQVSASSTPGVGSEFVVLLPQAPPAALPRASLLASSRGDGPAAPGGGALRRRRVLYVEDNPVNVMIMVELVARRGDLDLLTAADARSGLRLARADPPDLMLLDMNLPDGHGNELLAQLRADPLTGRVPCIAVSANAMPDDIRAALRSGFADYWTKPLDFEVVNRALDSVFGPPATAG